jgi:hypothetical protein
MQASNTCMPIAGHSGTIFVAIELSERNWLVTMHSPDRGRVSRHMLDSGDHDGLVALIEKVQARAARLVGAAPEVVSCYEAGYDGFWLHRRLAAAGITNLVFDPASIAVEQRGRRAKTDRIDGEVMLRTLMAHRRGEPRVVRVVHVPSVEHEDIRRGSRERQRLVTEQTGHINRIKGLLKLIGLGAGNVRRGVVALSHHGPYSRRSNHQGVSSTNAGAAAPHAAVRAGWMMTVPPLGQYTAANRRWVSSAFMASSPQACGMWARALGPTGYEVML